MALFYSLKHTKPTNFINHFKRFYFQIHSPALTNHTHPKTILNDHHFSNQAVFQRRRGFLGTGVRFFAAPVVVQVKKKEEVGPARPRLNGEIKIDTLRLVTDEGHTVMSIRDALQRAKELELDLVEVDRNAKPPVCKIMDYNRERYKKQLKIKERAKIKSAGSLRKGDCKEVRFSIKAELKDLKIKADAAKRLMERGYRVKCMALAAEDQDLSGLLSQITALIEDVAFVESGPKIEKRQGYLIVRHIKFGPSKKGGGNKAPKVKSGSSSDIQKETSTSGGSPVDLGEQTYAGESDTNNGDEESGSYTDDEVETPLHNKGGTSWSVSSASGANQDFDKLFDVNHDSKGARSSPDNQNMFDRGAASSTTNSNASTFSPSQAPNCMGPNVTSAQQEPQNRYARKVPKDASTVRNPMRFPNNGNQPQPHFSMNPTGGPRQAASEGSPSRNTPHPQNGIPQPRGEIPDQARQSDSPFPPHAGNPKPPSFTENRMPQSPGFGIFSGAKEDAPGSRESGGVVNQQNSGTPSNVIKKSIIPGNINQSPSAADSRPAGDSGKWGIFSGDSSNSVPGRNS